jgi:7-cyano-7-deazaguanine reductase
MNNSDFADDTPLGKSTETVSVYTPALLCPIARAAARADLGLVAAELPFTGVDSWNLYEVSWLNQSGVPQVAMGRLDVPCDSAYLIESKSLKLYLNSFNQSRFGSLDEVARRIEADLAARLDSAVVLKLWSLGQAEQIIVRAMAGESLDVIDVTIEHYTPEPAHLSVADGPEVEERLYSDLFRSLCPVTGQPDWGSISIAYRGQTIDRVGLLKYLISFRDHNGFHEQCVERIFVDIQRHCRPQGLSVYARFLRRGGVDINPFRTNRDESPVFERLLRQ